MIRSHLTSNHMTNINRIFNDQRLMKATTGLGIEAFNKLIEPFNKAFWEAAQKRYQRRKRSRQPKAIRRPGGGAAGRLNTVELKILFVLMYFKCYPTFDILGFFFDLDRSNAKCDIDHLTPVLEAALGKKMALPARKIRSIKEFLEIFPEAKDLFPDGTERRRQRPKYSKEQAKYYSGKKKTHTIKNLIISNENLRVNYLGKTVEGKRHDYDICKEQLNPSTVPKNVIFWTDKGFLGMVDDYPNATVIMPFKKPKGKELTAAQIEINRMISGIRMYSEHALAGVKRLRIVSDTFRNKSMAFADQAMYLACGLWNYQSSFR